MKAFRSLLTLALLATSLAFLSSCVYDPYGYYAGYYRPGYPPGYYRPGYPPPPGYPGYYRPRPHSYPLDGTYPYRSRQSPYATPQTPDTSRTPQPGDEPVGPARDEVTPDHASTPPPIADAPSKTPSSGSTSSASKSDHNSIPTATRINRPGRVKSPYPPYNELDVSGLQSGSLAKDPATGQVFRVP